MQFYLTSLRGKEYLAGAGAAKNYPAPKPCFTFELSQLTSTLRT